MCAPLPDPIGKIMVPERIRNRPGRLTPDEFDVMKGHVERDQDILNGAVGLTRTERADGGGYPVGLRGMR